MSLKDKSRELRRESTQAEKILWEMLRDHRFQHLQFRRQHPALKKYILDFYCPALKIAIEVDGKHHSEPETLAFDHLRSMELEAIGIRVLRLSNKDILEDIDKVRHILASKLERPLST